MDAAAIVYNLLEAPGQLRKLRDLQAQPDDQLYLCHDASVGERHKVRVPFECGCRQWVGAGMVKIEFYANDQLFSGHRFQESDYADIRSLEPVAGKTWAFDDLPGF